MNSVLTNRQAAVGAAQVNVALRDGCHAQLVERPAEEGGKGAGEDDVPVPGGTAHGHTHLRRGQSGRGAYGSSWGRVLKQIGNSY